MSHQSFAEAVSQLSGARLSDGDGDGVLAAVQVPFEELGVVQELAAGHGLEVEVMNRYTCYVDVPGGSDNAIEVTAPIPAMHIAQVYANCLVSLEIAIAQTSKVQDVHLDELLAQGVRDRESLWDRAVIWLGHIAPKQALEADLGEPVKANSPYAEVLATLLDDAGVVSSLSGRGMDAFALGANIRVLANLGSLKTARLLTQPTK